MNLRHFSLLAVLGLAACAGTDNAPQPTPLEKIESRASLTPVWRNSHASAGLYRFVPDQENNRLFVASAEKGVIAYGMDDGREENRFRPEEGIAGGVLADKGLVMVGSIKGRLFAFDQVSGALKWKAQLSSEIVSPPVSAEGAVIVRTGDGKITALNIADGQQRWRYEVRMPALVLRTYAPATLADGAAFIGVPGGKVIALSLADGRLIWEAAVAQPKGATELDRVADVASSPVINNGQVCAAAFQGKVACFAAANGNQIWSRELSSFAGVAMDRERVYVTDETGNVVAYDRNSGRSLWKQEKLYGRHVTGPTVYNGNVVVGDLEGVVHVLSAEDGSFLTRQTTDKSPIKVAPRVIGGKLVVQTSDGGVYAFASK
ncbi:outer membrane protein assembly factor BamB [Burkholderiaceae bacterium DAT-1]|nr:outer membrane protein assembly factor BamB [Burkholderiaceae bacterium DAT-1]